MEFLSEEWVAAWRAACAQLPERPGATGRLQVVVTAGGNGDVVWWLDFADGRAVDGGRGGPALGPDDEVPGGRPLVAITESRDVAAAVARGELELSAAFMQGRAKTSGDQAALLRLLAMTATPAYRAAARALAERTSG
jgi:SCP-2 sterol transfer family